MPTDSALGTTAPAAAPAAGAPTDAPLLPQDSSVFDSWAQAQESFTPDKPEGAAAPAPAKDPDPEPVKPVEQPKTTDKSDEAEVPADDTPPETDEKTPKQDEETPAAAPEAPVVEFVADEAFEAFTEKVDKFFDAYDVDPSIVAMKTGYEKQIQALSAQVSGQVEINENIKAAVDAFSAIDEFRKDETGRFIAKTNEAVAFVQANKSPEVFKQFVTDAMSAPSPKYKHLGFTMLHEMYVDAGVPPAKMDEFIKYVSGEAVPPALHPDLPTGVPVEVAEAYGKNSALRKVISDCAETLAWSEEDRKTYPEQYKEAKAEFADAVDALVSKQNDINKERNDKVAARQKSIDDQATFNNTVLIGTQEIQKAELLNFGKDLGEKLTAFIPDAAARSLQVTSYKQLIVNALADDVYGADARADLKAQGINIEYSKAQTLFQQIQDAVAQRQIILQQTGDEKAANKGVEKQLTNALRELGIMRRNIIGRVAQVVTKSYTNGDMKPAVTKPQLRPTLKGGRGAEGAKTGNMPNFQDPTEAGKWYGEQLFGAGRS